MLSTACFFQHLQQIPFTGSKTRGEPGPALKFTVPPRAHPSTGSHDYSPRRHVMSTDLSNLYRPQVHHKHTGARLPLLLHVLTRYSKGLRAQPAGTGDGGPNGFADDSDGGAAPKSAAAAEREASETRVVAASPKGFEEPPGGSSNGDEAVTGGDGFGLTSNAPAKMESRRSVPPEDGVEFVRVGGGGGIQLPPGDVGVAGFAALPKMLSRMSLALLLLAAVGSTFDGISCIVGSASLSQSILVEKAVVSTLRTSSASMRTERSRFERRSGWSKRVALWYASFTSRSSAPSAGTHGRGASSVSSAAARVNV